MSAKTNDEGTTAADGWMDSWLPGPMQMDMTTSNDEADIVFVKAACLGDKVVKMNMTIMVTRTDSNGTEVKKEMMFDAHISISDVIEELLRAKRGERDLVKSVTEVIAAQAKAHGIIRDGDTFEIMTNIEAIMDFGEIRMILQKFAMRVVMAHDQSVRGIVMAKGTKEELKVSVEDMVNTESPYP